MAGCVGDPVDVTRTRDLGGGGDLRSAADSSDRTDLTTTRDYVLEPIAGAQDLIVGVWGSSANDVYVLDLFGGVFHSSGDGVWSQQRTGTNGFNYSVLWGSGADDIWAGGGVFPCSGLCQPKLLHSTGDGNWSEVTVPGSSPDHEVQIDGLGGTGKNDIYAAIYGPDGVQGVLHSSNGTTFVLQPTDRTGTPYGLFAASATNLYLVREATDVVHSSGNGSWAVEATTSDSMTAIGGSSSSDLWAAGYQDNVRIAIYHSTGNGVWTPQIASYVGPPFSVSAPSPTSIFVGCNEALLHSTGNGVWTPEILPPASGPPSHVAAFGDGQVYVSATAAVLHKR
jgi:hypothetical protein